MNQPEILKLKYSWILYSNHKRWKRLLSNMNSLFI